MEFYVINLKKILFIRPLITLGKTHLTKTTNPRVKAQNEK